MTAAKPLAPYRVLELGTRAGAHCGRLLADLGAEVVKVESRDGDPMRRQGPFVGGESIGFHWYNANKAGVTIDLESPASQAEIRAALGTFDLLIDGNRPGWLAAHGLEPASLRAQYPELVIVSVSEFGQWGPYRDWEGSSLVAWALAGSLIRCGLPDAAPVSPPYQMSYALAGITAASAAVLALWERNRTGKGDWLDCSVLEAVQAQADWTVPGYGATGMSVKRAGAGALYPLFRAADGWVRMVNLSPRQWRSLRAWLGNPPEIAAPEWDNPLYRGANRAVLDALCEAKCAGREKAELAADGQSNGVGIVPVYPPMDLMEDDEHFRERGTFVSFPIPGAARLRAPGSFVRMDCARPESPKPAPVLGAAEGLTGRPVEVVARGGRGAPLSGYRVVEVGSGAVAPEVTRILGEYGADVIKLESRQQLDFMRIQGGGGNLEASTGWSSSNRNKRSVLVDLKHEIGNRIARELCESADIIVENNTAAVMPRLNIGYEALAEKNPKLVYLSSQAFGATGPAANYGGFGPTNAAVSSTSYLWSNPDAEKPEGTQVIFPDIILGRAGALAVMAAMDEMVRSGRGQHIDMCQAEFAMACVAEAFIESDAIGESVPKRGNAQPIGAPWGVFPSLADDSWVAITVESDEQWRALKGVVNNPTWDDDAFDTMEGRMENRDLIEAELSAFTQQQTNVALMRRLQAAGVPAGAAYTTSQVLADVHLSERKWPVVVDHPVLGTLWMEGVPFKSETLHLDPAKRAPLFGEHTDEVLREWLGMEVEAIDAARKAGALT